MATPRKISPRKGPTWIQGNELDLQVEIMKTIPCPALRGCTEGAWGKIKNHKPGDRMGLKHVEEILCVLNKLFTIYGYPDGIPVLIEEFDSKFGNPITKMIEARTQ